VRGAGRTAWGSRRVALAASVLLVALAGGVPASASGPAPPTASVAGAKVAGSAWSKPERITGHELGTGRPVPVAFDSNGDAFLVFGEANWTVGETITLSYPVRVTLRPAGGHWQTPDTLSLLGIGLDLAVDQSGDAIAVWSALSGIEEAERPAGGGWLPAKQVLAPGEDPQVATDALGDAVVASNRQAPHRSHGIQVAMRSAGGQFSAPQMISGSEDAFEPRVAMNARGDVVVAWREFPAHGCRVRVAFYRAGRGWSAPRTVSDTHASGEGQRVAIDERGDATVIWSAQRGRHAFVELATRDSAGRWTTGHVLARTRATVLKPEVGMDPSGDAVAAWWQDGDERVAARPAGGRWLAPRRLADNSRNGPASLAIDRRGDALLAWAGTSAIIAAAKTPAQKTWRESVVASGRDIGADPAVTIDAGGDAVVAWQGNSGLFTAWRTSLFG
jgi:hypothetical protein